MGQVPPSSQQRRDQAALARSVVDALSDPAVVVDDRVIVLAANAPMHEALGLIHAGEHLSRSVRHPALANAVAACLGAGQKTLFEMSSGPGGERRMDGTAGLITGASYAPGGSLVLVVLKDISEREALARMRMEFVANASHELRTPLAALSGFIETLRGPARSDRAAHERFLAIMADQAQRMTRLIDDLLLLSRVEMRAHIAPTATADLNHVASEAIKIAGPLAKAGDIRFEQRLGAAPAVIQGDHDELVIAVQNLLSNAIKYGRAAGRVIVAVEPGVDLRLGQVVALKVTDEGAGIAPEHLPRLTERFYRVNTAASREKGGTGLGLAIVKHIAARHRGRIDVESTLGVGTTFTLTLPRRPSL